MRSSRPQGLGKSLRPDHKMAVTIVYVLGVFILIIDTTIVNVALPAIGRDFGVPANTIQWVVLGYLLTLAIGIPAAPWLASRIGPRKAFVSSLAGFVVASAIAGLAPSVNWLIAARVLQGLPAGLITPIGAAMLYRAYPQNERARAAAAVVGVSVLAPSVGPVLGGVIVDNLSWPWIFFVNVPIGLAAIVLAYVWLGEGDRDPSTAFDRIGFALAGTGLATFLYAISAGPEQGWASPIVLGSLAVGITCLVVLVRFEMGHSDPLIEFRLLADRHFRTINLVGLSVYAAFISFVYVLPIYLQSFVGVSATQAGTTQVPQALAVFTVSNFLARRTYNRYGARLVLGIGAFAGLTVSGLFVFVGEDPNLWILRAGTWGRGFTMGFVFVTIQTVAYATTSLADTGRAVSIFSTQRQLANALGVAIVATVLTSSLNLDLGLNAYRLAFGASAALFVPAIIWAAAIREADVSNTRTYASTTQG